MIITINIDTASLTPTELGVLAALSTKQDLVFHGSDPVAKAPKAAELKTANVPEARAEAPKGKPEPEPVEDLVGTDDAPTLDDAVARATALVSEGKAAAVKAALATAGSKRVSELATPAKIQIFLDALDG